MACGIYGTIRPADVSVDDIDIYYNYTPSREVKHNQIFKLNASELLSYNYIPSDDDTYVENNENLLEGLYNLRLPADIFNQLGIYTIYIKPKITPIVIVDCSVLSSLPSIIPFIYNLF